jgi:hypothetical protein
VTTTTTRPTYEPTTDDGVTYCVHCYCVSNMHDEYSGRCPTPEDFERHAYEAALVREYELYARYHS